MGEELAWCDPATEECPTDLQTLMGDEFIAAADVWHSESMMMWIMDMPGWPGLVAYMVIGLMYAVVPTTFHFVYRNRFDYFTTTTVTAPMYKAAWWTFWITNLVCGSAIAVMGVFPFFKMWGDINMYVVGGANALATLMGLIYFILYAVAAGQAYGNNDFDTVDTIQREVTMIMTIETLAMIFLLVNFPSWWSGNMMTKEMQWSEEDHSHDDEMVAEVEETPAENETETLESATAVEEATI